MSADGEETVIKTVSIPKPLHKEAKLQAVIEERTPKEIVVDALEQYVQKWPGHPHIHTGSSLKRRNVEGGTLGAIFAFSAFL